jgi:lipopolysaccharide biosynthesis glycosyltransferase
VALRSGQACDQRIDIAFGLNSTFVPHAAGALASLKQHARAVRMRIIILHDGIGRDLRARLEAEAPEAEFIWEEIADADLPPFVDHQHFNRSTMFRFALDTRAPADCNRVIYIDADLTVCDDIRELWSFDLGDAPLAAVIDGFADPVAFAHKWGLSESGEYFNAGVLLLDLDQIRRRAIFARALEFYAAHAADLPWNDQDCLNYLLWDEWVRLDNRWNVQRSMALPNMNARLPAHKRFNGGRPGIVHYTGPEKPWVMSQYHPWAALYWRAMARTGFYSEMKTKAGYGLVQQIRTLIRWLSHHPYLRRALSVLLTRSGSSAAAPATNDTRLSDHMSA